MKRRQKISSLLVLLAICSLLLILVDCPLGASDENLKNGLSNQEFIINDISTTDLPSPLNLGSITDLNLFPPTTRNFRQPRTADLAFQKQKKINFDPQQYWRKRQKLDRIEGSLYTTSLVTLSLLNIADYFSTVKALKYDGLKEANPFMKPFTKNALLFAAVKAGLTIYNIHVLKKIHRKNKRLAWVISTIGNLALSYIVVHNIKITQKAQ